MKNILITVALIALGSSSAFAKFTQDQAKDMFDYLLSNVEYGKTYVLTEKGEVTKGGQFLCDYTGVSEQTLLKVENGVYTFSYTHKDNANENCQLQTLSSPDYTSVNDPVEMAKEFFDLQGLVFDMMGIDMVIKNDTKEIVMSLDGDSEVLKFEGLNIIEFDAKMTEGGNGSSGDLGYTHGAPVYSVK
jgi:hypothetical protein